jgi:hypothetical protein
VGGGEGTSGLRSPIRVVESEFGPGGRVRPGAITSLRLRLLLTDAEGARDVIVRFGLRDTDGDTAMWQRYVTLTSGVERDVFLYVAMPWNITTDQPFLVTFHDVNDAGEAVRLIGDHRVQLPIVLPVYATQIGVIGSSGAALEQYELTRPGVSANQRLNASHVHHEVVRGLNASTLPDRWFGLSAFSVIVWTGGNPDALSSARAAALSEWVSRGGHLVIVLPSIADVWTDAAANPIHALLPDATVTRIPDANLEPYRNLLTKPIFDEFPLPERLTVRVFEPRDAARPIDAMPIIDGPDGAVVIRRVHGTGFVTVVGLPVAEQSLRVAGLLRADAFWHRVLGYRFDIVSQRYFRALEEQGQASNLRSPGDGIGMTRDDFVDDVIPEAIARSGVAAGGLLLALVVFVIYWLVGGPLGFMVLSKKGWRRHAWVGFVACIAVFSVIAWVGARLISPGSASVAQFAVIDHVYGQPGSHVRAWGSVLLPSYGDRTVVAAAPGGAVGDESGVDNDIIYPFADPRASLPVTFPDARPYPIELDAPSSVTVPTRSTVKQFAIDWQGRIDVGMPAPPDAGLRPSLNADGSLSGVLTHSLPGSLRDVNVYVFGPQYGEAVIRGAWQTQVASNRFGFERAPGVRAAVGAPIGAWEPGEAFDLATLGIDLADLSDQPSASAPERLSRNDRTLHNISMLGYLTQPLWFSTRSMSDSQPLRARLAQNLDLSRWSTQPTLIITGVLVPAGDDGREQSFFAVPAGDGARALPLAGSEARTVIRWICPLEARPPDFFGRGVPGRTR